MNLYGWKRVSLALSVLLLGACELMEDKPPTPPPLQLLAHVAHFSIARQTVRLPLVAVSSGKSSNVIILCSGEDYDPTHAYRFGCSLPLKEIVQKSSNAKAPIPVTALRINLEHFSIFRDRHDYVSAMELCGMLSQEWARQICQHDDADSFFGLRLQNFSLVEESYVGIINDWISGSPKSLGTAVQKTLLKGNTPSSFCGLDKNGQPLSLCYAAMRLSNNLLAVWIVTRAESGEKALARQARVIRTFMEFGIGETENFPALKAVLR